MDKILIRGLKIFAFHGVNPEEKRDGQNFILDIDAYEDARPAGRGDRLEDATSYSEIIESAVRIFCERKDDLIERAAERTAEGLLNRFDKIQSLRILVKKPDAPIKADFEYVGVEIFRSRKDGLN